MGNTVEDNVTKIVENFDIERLVHILRERGVQGVAPAIDIDDQNFIAEFHNKLVSLETFPRTDEIYRMWRITNKMMNETIPSLQEKVQDITRMWMRASLLTPRLM